MNVSIIICILNSHEFVRRQILYFKSMNLTDDVEFIFMDDNSDPPLNFDCLQLNNLHIYPTNDARPWTVCLYRNAAARIAKGRNLLMTDIDHIISRDGIEQARCFTGDRMTFIREFGVLDENGILSQNYDDLIKWGLPEERIKNKGVRCPAHGNSFIMNKNVFWKVGGYREDKVGTPYPQQEEHSFRYAYRKAQTKRKVTTDLYRPKIYHVPNGHYCGDPDYNPFNLFHTLSRKKCENLFN